MSAVYLGRAIACARIERGMKRKDLVAAAGVSYPFLAEIENGQKVPSAVKLFAICTALGVRSSEILAHAEQIGRDFPVS